jgi:hypothetical protein
MIQRISIFGIVIFLAIFFQCSFILIESIDHPQKAVVSFCKAYYQLDTAAKNFLTDDCYVKDDVDLVEQYVNTQKKIAADRGYRDNFLTNYLTHIHTHVIKQTSDSAVVNIKAKRFAIIPWLRHRKCYDVDHTFTLTYHDNRWLISGGIAEM